MRNALVLVLIAGSLAAQTGQLRPAPYLSYPSSVVDGNSPGLWVDGELKVYTSTGDLLKMEGRDYRSLYMDTPPVVTGTHQPMWIESIWRDPEEGTVYGWYHLEPGGYCPGRGLTVPRIGALVSHDGGETFEDLGTVLSSGDAPNCNAENGFFAGGHGDFSVVLDPRREYFYFLFDNYGGPAATQGVALARLAYGDRANPVGYVQKYFAGRWEEAGIGGRVTPVLPVRVSWDRSNTDAFWGPSVSWNTFLEKYVILLNRACCKPRWPQEGIYLAFSEDLENPASWSTPAKILTPQQIGFAPGYYPQLVGTAAGESDSLTGQVSRLYVKGISKWELAFADDSDDDDGYPDDPSKKPGDPDPGIPVPPQLD